VKEIDEAVKIQNQKQEQLAKKGNGDRVKTSNNNTVATNRFNAPTPTINFQLTFNIINTIHRQTSMRYNYYQCI
jgi:hypothetical protein